MVKSIVFSCVLLLLCPALVVAKEKVILDSDMVAGFDDGIAMLMLGTSPAVELLGVTIVAGNTWVEEGTAHALRQLELVGLDVPVSMGVNQGMRPLRQERLDAEQTIYGAGQDDWVGALSIPRPESWQRAYQNIYHSEPKLRPVNQHAADFIIEQVKKYPGEVTVAAIGPCGNLAMALLKAPEIAPLIKRVIYMGGAFFVPGNTTPAAEFNFWFDPEAARLAVSAPFAEQLFVSLDLCEKFPFTREHYEQVKAALGTTTYGEYFSTTMIPQLFEKNKIESYFVWDTLVAALIISPELMQRSHTAQVEVDAEFGPSYGQSLAYRPGTGPEGSREATIVTDINQQGFWGTVISACNRIVTQGKA